MRIFMAVMAFLCLFAAYALYDTAPNLIQNSDWISPGIVRMVAYLAGAVGLLLVITTVLPRGRKKSKA